MSKCAKSRGHGGAHDGSAFEIAKKRSSNYPRALEVSIGIFQIETLAGIRDGAGGGGADMCGGVAHACSFKKRCGGK